MNERGITLVELVTASAVAGIVFVGLATFYLWTDRAIAENDAQAALQRQGTLIIDEMTRQIQLARILSRGTCNSDPNSIGATNQAGTVCFCLSGNQLKAVRNLGEVNLATQGVLARRGWTVLANSFVTSIDVPQTLVTVTFQLQYADGTGKTHDSMTFKTAIARRN